MRLAQHTDYAMRVLIYAAAMWPTGKLSSIEAISTAYGISQNHLMKVVHRLGLLGLLVTRRGRNGGLCLAQDPATLRLGATIAALEADLALVECFSASGSACPLLGACGFAGAVEEAKGAFLRSLDGYTLADVVPGSARSPAMHRKAMQWHPVLRSERPARVRAKPATA
ncbi:MAG: Nitrite-sensitive transcriptional repressor NsrR [uncultured Ramlibacter sp.]|uniref:Nitrite-sensitive transcriptional repressor NsrR n=1 Tax=uncultured Ramlibacter sp. TaxID=260755 RepID=A0A6J4PLR4_9BURK|nr:MAG: Nitrite-sensitive transcriptional repressor NsrR [uncultured Ramlibacter sp.]